jgi:enamine deaminase RidA (YjgF/YER057c/UK114 family)
MHRPLLLIAISLMVSTGAAAQRRDSVPTPDFPSAQIAETKSLEFHAARPARGSLDEQISAELGELVRLNRGARIVKLRVFAVGDSALERSRQAIARAFGKSGLARPVLSFVGVAGFPDSSQLVEIESTAAWGHAVNAHGVGFIAGVASPAGDRTIAGLARVASDAGIPNANVLRVSCFYERADQVETARSAIASTFRGAEASFVKSYALSTAPAIECEAVARLATTPASAKQYFNRPSVPASPSYSHAALVATRSVVFSRTETAASASDSDMHAMLDRAKNDVAQYGASLADVVMGDNYWLTGEARDTMRVVRSQYFGGTVPAATGVFFTSLSPASASAAIELVVAADSSA